MTQTDFRISILRESRADLVLREGKWFEPQPPRAWITMQFDRETFCNDLVLASHELGRGRPELDGVVALYRTPIFFNGKSSQRYMVSFDYPP